MGQSYAFLTHDMTWSYSRLSAFEGCKYAWLLKYIFEETEEPMFFSSFGSYMHDILRRVFSGDMSATQAANEYLSNYCDCVCNNAAIRGIYSDWFRDGLLYLRNSPIPAELAGRKTLSVEQKFDVIIGGLPFTGFIDLLTYDDGIVITDHKSRTIRNPSGKKNPTLYDKERESMLRQLYLYAAAVGELYGEYPVRLEFNCFRSSRIIPEPFCEDKMYETLLWANSVAASIQSETTWRPDVEYFKCRNLCGFTECPYRSAT